MHPYLTLAIAEERMADMRRQAAAARLARGDGSARRRGGAARSQATETAAPSGRAGKPAPRSAQPVPSQRTEEVVHGAPPTLSQRNEEVVHRARPMPSQRTEEVVHPARLQPSQRNGASIRRVWPARRDADGAATRPNADVEALLDTASDKSDSPALCSAGC